MCDCAKRINESLMPHNYQLSRNLFEGDDAPALVEVAKIERRKRTPSYSLVASYCPFCGEKYPKHEPHGVLKAQKL